MFWKKLGKICTIAQVSDCASAAHMLAVETGQSGNSGKSGGLSDRRATRKMGSVMDLYLLENRNSVLAAKVPKSAPFALPIRSHLELQKYTFLFHFNSCSWGF